MAKYMIHAVPKRMWYVNDYLIPSMIEQGINKNDIKIHADINQEGNLKSCMNAFLEVDASVEGTWHLQDDVIISHDFKEKTEEYDYGIVCGFKSRYDGKLRGGQVHIKDMWFSFPCIRIPNDIAIACANWVFEYIMGNRVYTGWWQNGVNDDLIFKQYLKDYHKNMLVWNLNPNIVDHVDYLIGGSVNGTQRNNVLRSDYWQDEYLVTELESKLKNVI